MDNTPQMEIASAGIFIDYCKSKFGWSDLSKDVIMDVGCGEHGYCGKSILEKFPDVRAVIFTDKQPKVVHSLKRSIGASIECDVVDIEKRESFRNYEGKMTKVILTHVFQHVRHKEEAFRNMYRLLKPGGQAAILFVNRYLLYDWLTEILKIPKWKEAYQNGYEKNLFEGESGSVYYKEMVENVGFQLIDYSEVQEVLPYPSDAVCKEGLYEVLSNYFKVSPELLEEFKEDSFQIFMKFSKRTEDGRPCYRRFELSLLLVKPTEGPVSETKKTLAS